MLRTCTTALLLSRDAVLSEKYRSMAPMCNVELTVADKWNLRFKASQDVIVAEKEFMRTLPVEYRSRIVMVLEEGDRIADVRNMADRFIFDRNNMQELMYAFLVNDDEKREEESLDMRELLSTVRRSRFRRGDYDFDFASGTYRYRGRGIYLTRTQRLVLARWLLLGKRDHRCAMQLYLMRKKFGSEFMADVGRFGEIRRNV